MSSFPSNLNVLPSTTTSAHRVGRTILISLALLFVAVFLIFPILVVFVEAFARGWQVYCNSVYRDDVFAALKLTFFVTLISVPCNMLFGIAASWAITKFDFRGKGLLSSLIDIPLAVSPVVAGMMYVEVFGAHGWFGPWLRERGIHVIFSVPGIVLATIFVTFPFVARELIPFMEAQGSEEEEAAVVLGASAWHIFWRVTLPNIKWALLYGAILAASRSIGEFGAVSVVSGHIRGETTTLPLQVEMFYDEYNFTAAFAAASLLTCSAIGTLFVKKLVESVSGIGSRSHRKTTES